MVTNKALAELQAWASAAHEGRGDDAKQHLIAFAHVAAGLVGSQEFRHRCRDLLGRELESRDVDSATKLLDALANIEVGQARTYGVAEDKTTTQGVISVGSGNAPGATI